jgi:hypothetical protein
MTKSSMRDNGGLEADAMWQGGNDHGARATRRSRLIAAIGLIAGTWQALFENPYLGFTLACSLSVSATGAISDGACDIGSLTHGAWTLTQPPWGTLTINRACKVVAAISYTVCSPPPCGNPATSMTTQNQALLWRSRDGSRLSGFTQWKPGQNITEIYRLDFIASP